MSHDRDVVIVSAARTPIGKFGGSLKDVRASSLLALVMEEVLKRAGNPDPAILDEVVTGDCAQCFDEANTARTAMLKAGLPVEIPAHTIQRQCASSMQALAAATQMIRAEDAEVVLVGGVESMSSAPYYLPKARWGMRLMNHEVLDSVWEMLHSGSRLLGNPMIMGQTAENLAQKYGIDRQEQDEVALRSHHNAEAAIKEGRFKDEIVPVEIPGPKGKVAVFEQDEHPRFGLTMDDLSRLKPVFKKDGTVTAGNSSGLNDGAAAALVMTRAKAKEMGLQPLARIVATAAAGVEPEYMGYGPVPATEKVLKKAGMTLKDIQLIELNEAFAAQYLACERGIGFDRAIANVNGSGIALGHPVGCTGLRIVISLAYEMARRDLSVGLATLCVGGGMGMATIVARD
ncbi:acetyl-CoA C-acetyltransferase [Desulfacinum hydrothermale DSM 13146]|uniref:Acetyl-CoA C-acetyltransferase n=1 Tax=Desulfacinum hydrothermale DSM 13146 TaxID=1121390 RepID=A0A1W1XEX4_9BACT|nr:thiolase family protein [Desulfacinum hydrothermale]SMC22362.1 acetyl-CoA C-acetyltransferase [Desulfacinum hydrothermale DSM 13146]